MVHLSDEERLILETVKRLAKEQIRPRASELDQKGEFPWETVQLFTQHGVLTPLIPEKYGGIGARYILFAMIVEEIAKYCASSALLLIAQADGMMPILIGGEEELRVRYFPRLLQGRLAALAATEPQAGSDVLAMRTRALRTPGGYILNGQKCFITNGSVADIICVYAYTDSAKKAKGMSCFVIEKHTKGLSYGKNENKMGMRGSVNSELFFEDMFVPEGNRVGAEGEGFYNLMRVLDGSRMFVAAQAVGIAQGALEEGTAYARNRIQFGKPISEHQAIQLMIAEMAARIEAARLLTYKAALTLDARDQKTAPRLCAMAKFLASDIAMKVTTDAVQVLGGYGYMKDFPVERMMRDAKLTQIYTGTNQILRLVAARSIFRD